MSRSLSAAAWASIAAQETGEVWLALLTIAHASIATIRLVNNTKDVVSGGNTYTAFPFAVTIPPEHPDRPPEVMLVADAIDRSVVDAIRAIPAEPTVTLSLVLASAPDLVEAGPFAFTMYDAAFDAHTVECRLGYERVLTAPYPADVFTPSLFPGLFP